MYLALALKQFVLNVTGDLRTQWTWKRCLLHAIEAMNDVGVKYYSSFTTLAQWHRKFARNRSYFYKAPDAKTVRPRFFVDNPDAIDAFKKHGIANIKDLRVKMMLKYVHHELVPKLMRERRDGCLFDDSGDDAHDDVVLGLADKLVTPTTRAAFLQSYGLSSISIATMARWMHACGFRYEKRKKHYLLTVMKDRKQLRTNRCLLRSTLDLKYEPIVGSKSCWKSQIHFCRKETLPL